MDILHIDSASKKAKIDEVWFSQKTSDGLFSLITWLEGMNAQGHIGIPGQGELSDFYSYLCRLVESKQEIARNTKIGD